MIKITPQPLMLVRSWLLVNYNKEIYLSGLNLNFSLFERLPYQYQNEASDGLEEILDKKGY